MPISTQCLESYVNSCASASPNVVKNQQLSGIAPAIESAAIGCSVANTASLPLASDNEGRWIFVEDIGAYRYSNGQGWSNDYATNCILQKNIYVSGRNDAAQLGTNNTVCYSSPVRESSVSANWCDISAGFNFSIALKSDSSLWGWGYNGWGALATNNTVCYSSPVQEFTSSSWTHIGSGCPHTMGIKTDGTLWSWGCSGVGALGHGVASIRVSSPVQEFCSASNWCGANGGRDHTIAVKTDGTLWSWGCNLYGRLGDGTQTNRCSPVQEISSSSDWCYGEAGPYHSHGIKTDGTLWSWGWSGYINLGTGNTTCYCSPVQEFCSDTTWTHVTGGYNTIALKTDGTIWGWGYAGSGSSLTNRTSCSPVQEPCSATNWCYVDNSQHEIGNKWAAALKTDGTMWVGGINWYGATGLNYCINSFITTTTQVCDFTDVEKVSVGPYHGMTIRAQQKGFNEP